MPLNNETKPFKSTLIYQSISFDLYLSVFLSFFRNLSSVFYLVFLSQCVYIHVTGSISFSHSFLIRTNLSKSMQKKRKDKLAPFFFFFLLM